MTAVREQYRQFLGWLRDQDPSEDVVRVAKIVFDNLDAIIPTVSNRGQRSAVLAPIVRRALPETSPDLPEEAQQAPVALTWTRLRLLSVGPFRGFRYEHRFDLNRRVVLFQGPNGSGKTSLCEALEFALLGSVEEASAKRIDSLEAYFQNIHDQQYVAPRVWAVGSPDREPIQPNPDLLQFALIEKNRIEDFARIAAHRPSEAGALVATLFGLEGFSEFVRNFTSSLDTNLTLNRTKAALLAARRQALAHAEAEVAREHEILADRDRDERELAQVAGMGYQDLLQATGLLGGPGRLQQLVEATDQPPRAPSGLRPSVLARYRRELNGATIELQAVQEQLRNRAAEVNFNDLYDAVLAVQDHSPDQCPACTTPLAHTVANPFERAHQGQVALAELAELERRAQVHRARKEELAVELQRYLENLARHVARGDAPALPEIKPAAVDKDAWLEWLMAARDALLEDRQVAKEAQARAELIAERNRLDGWARQATVLMERRRTATQLLADYRASIRRFEEENAQLIADVPVEATLVESEERIRSAYTGFRAAIEAYLNGRPAQLLANLNELTRDLYNSFNVRDADGDKLASVALPLQGGDRTQITFRGKPNQSFDALHILSEGHIRCLGLAILLAKNIQLGLPIVVFDDAVNAIDHDHRQGLRETLFDHPQLADKQLIITSHSPEFIKDISQQDAQALVHFLAHHAGDYQPRVLSGDSRHYLTMAREQLDRGDPRQCLTNCRQAMENLVYRTWRKLPSDHALLKVPVKGPEARGDLFAVAQLVLDRLNDLLDRTIITGDRWNDRRDGLRAIIGIPGNSLTYACLNKGTHEELDREDFELGTIESVMQSLTQINHSFRP